MEKYDQFERDYDNRCSEYLRKYEKIFDEVSSHPNFAHKSRQFHGMDVVNLGDQIEMYKRCGKKCDYDLEKLETFVVKKYPLSIAPILCGMQTICDERDCTIFYKSPLSSDFINQRGVTPCKFLKNLGNPQTFNSLDKSALGRLAAEHAKVESENIIKEYEKLINAPTSTPLMFDLISQDGVSEYIHKTKRFKSKLSEAGSEISRICNGNYEAHIRYIVGRKAYYGLFRALDGFVSNSWEIPPGPHVVGYFEGQPVIFADNMNDVIDKETGERIEPDNIIIAAFVNPKCPYDAPVIEATFNPIYQEDNKAIASNKVFEGVVQEYTKLIILKE